MPPIASVHRFPSDDAHPSRAGIGDERLDTLRQRLLDLTNRNRLLNFRHADNARWQVRIVDELPDALFAALDAGRTLTFKELPPLPDEPEDERTPAFRAALGEAKLTDEVYRGAVIEAEAADEAEDSPALSKAERRLRDAVRRRLGLPERKSLPEFTLKEHARSHGVAPEFDLPAGAADGTTKAAHADDRIRVLHTQDAMRRKLDGVQAAAGATIRELGVNSLHACFGFLEWAEDGARARTLLAPLVLLPLTIERRLRAGRYAYAIRGTGDEAGANVVLAERLRRDFGLALPAFGEDDTPEAYLARVAEGLPLGKGWRVRRFVTVAQLMFARMAMYHDLAADGWPNGGAAGHPVAGALLAGRGEGAGMGRAPAHDPDAQVPDAERPRLVLDADASQYSAVVDVLGGADLVIEGPPGTGKSQTIANIIAAALGRGRTVLFVAEKAAALEVVQKRLVDVGLGPFCLGLHATKTGKAAVLAALKARLDVEAGEAASEALRGKLAELRHAKDRLNAHVRALDAPLGAAGHRVVDALWLAREAEEDGRGLPSSAGLLPWPAALDLTAHDLEDTETTLAAYGEEVAAAIEAHGRLDRHPFYGVHAGTGPFARDTLLDAMTRLGRALADVEGGLSGLVDLSEGDPSSLADVRRRLAVADHLPPGERLNGAALAHLRDPKTREALDDLAARRRGAEGVRHEIEAAFRSGEVVPSSQAASELVTAVRRAGWPADRPLGEIASEAARETAVAGEVEHARRGIERLARGFGVAAEPSARVLAVLLDAAELIDGASAETLRARTPALLAEGAVEGVARLRDRLDSIDRLARSCPLRVEAADWARDLDTFRRHASVCREAGALAMLSGPYREARKACQALGGRAGAPNAVMASAFEAAAAYLVAVRDLEFDRRARDLMGRRLGGDHVDLDRLAAVAAFGVAVRERLSGFDALTTALRERLLAGVPDGLRAAATACPSGERARLRAAVVSLAPDAPLDRLADAAAARAAVLGGLAGRCEPLPLAATATVRRVDAVLPLLDAHHDLRDGERRLGAEAARGGTDLETLLAHLTVLRPFLAAADRRAADKLLDAQGPSWAAGVARAAGGLRPTLVRVDDGLAALAEAGARTAAYFGNDPETLPVSALRARLAGGVGDAHAFDAWRRLQRLADRLRARGLGDLLAAVADGADDHETCLAPSDLGRAGRLIYANALVREAFARHGPVLDRDDMSLTEARRRLCALEEEILALERRNIAATLAGAEVDPGAAWGGRGDWTGLALIRNEVNKKKRHIPLRALFRRAGEAIRRLTPCLMMSPLSVAQHLGRETVFDLVVIDEASQMRPEDALGAVLRGRQLVVVGDPMQLPPTSFFNGVADDGDDGGGDGAGDVAEEAVLDMASDAFAPSRHLLWHYRSRHESLIAFSNTHFYEGRLRVLPSPAAPGAELGVHHTYVERAAYADGLNPKEAEATLDATLAHMRAYPDKSLIVVAMNGRQRDLIQWKIDDACLRDDLGAAYVERWKDGIEPFLVKNLENVQGDERDVVIVSTTYGPSKATGRVAQRFGPINSRDGHRRLNVLFTRAKERVELITSLNPATVVPLPTASRGVHALRDYLAYAATGHLPSPSRDGGEPSYDSPFERHVAELLRRRGYEVDSQVGVAGFRIDLGVRHPRYPHGYLAGVECDGAAYHRSLSARDRDKLRQEILEGLGWRIHRIWSTDWFRSPKDELDRLAEQIERWADEALAKHDDDRRRRERRRAEQEIVAEKRRRARDAEEGGTRREGPADGIDDAREATRGVIRAGDRP